MIKKKKRERWKDKRNRVVRKRKKKVEMVDDQTVNQAANPLKKGKKLQLKLKKKKKRNHQFWDNRIAALVFLMLVL
jgi:hypothetical protein